MTCKAVSLLVQLLFGGVRRHYLTLQYMRTVESGTVVLRAPHGICFRTLRNIVFIDLGPVARCHQHRVPYSSTQGHSYPSICPALHSVTFPSGMQDSTMLPDVGPPPFLPPPSVCSQYKMQTLSTNGGKYHVQARRVRMKSQGK